MKKIFFISIIIMAIGCNRYKPNDPDATFVMLQNDVEVGDTILYNTFFDLIHQGGEADKVAFFLGSIGKRYSVAKNAGQAADINGRLLNQKFTVRGTNDTITCVATCIGEFGDTIVQDVKTKIVYIK